MYSTPPCDRLLVGASGSIHVAQLGDYLFALKRSFTSELRLILTASASEMVSSRHLSLYTDGAPVTDIWGNSEVKAPHISLSRWAEMFLVLPASADILGKAANGIADDLLSTTIVSYERTIVFAPAMNAAMWKSRAVQRNVETLESDGHYVLQPEPITSITSEESDSGFGPTPDTLLAAAWHVRMRLLRAGYWKAATTTAPASPYEQRRQLEIVQVTGNTP
ncbi:MAG TPA: flavoprotein [Nocardioides sp.]|uniref:flavoprotein n=1 Tax=Nocardioides sp. TaxID=35761 RepID=UPI002F3F2CB5